jgi:hypothetical protein
MSQCNFNKCGDKEAPVATFVANILLTLDNAGLQHIFWQDEVLWVLPLANFEIIMLRRPKEAKNA